MYHFSFLFTRIQTLTMPRRRMPVSFINFAWGDIATDRKKKQNSGEEKAKQHRAKQYGTYNHKSNSRCDPPFMLFLNICLSLNNIIIVIFSLLLKTIMKHTVNTAEPWPWTTITEKTLVPFLGKHHNWVRPWKCLCAYGTAQGTLGRC